MAFGVVKALLDDGQIRSAGLSNVTVEDIETARRVFTVATMQNRFNLTDWGSEAVLDYSEREAIGFIPRYLLAAGELTKPGAVLVRIAKAHRATPGQVALAWVLKQSVVMLPFPGRSKAAHLEENGAAVGVELSDDAFATFNKAARVAAMG